MNNKKSKRLKRNNKIRNTRKNNKKGGVFKNFIQLSARGLVSSFLHNPQFRKKNLVYNNIRNVNNVNKSIKPVVALEKQLNTTKIKDSVQENVKVNKPKSPHIKRDDRVKFSELASENWFKPVNDLTSKINKRQKSIKLLLYLNELVKEYNSLYKSDNEEAEKIQEEIQTTIFFLDNEDAKKYNINKNNNHSTYIPDTKKIEDDMKILQKESTFTYNLLKNIDISPKEIQIAYCKKWTRNICEEHDTPLELMRRMVSYIGNNIANNISHRLFGSVLPDDKINSGKQEKKSVKSSIFNRLPTNVPGPYTYVPWYNIRINGIATVKTIYGALYGFDENWLHNILGILDPIINTVFDEIKKFDLDFTTLLLSSMSGKTEEEIYIFFETHKNIEKLKNKFNEFLKRNADSFSKEYKNTHFIEFSEEFQKKIKEALTEQMKDAIETEYHNMEERVAQKILTITNGLSEFRKEWLLFIKSNDNFDEFNILLGK